MKPFILTVIFFLGSSQGAWAASEGPELNGTDMVNCNATGTKCLHIRSEKMIGSKMKQLEVIKNPDAEMVENGKHRILHADTGYVDLTEARVVLITRNKDGSADERSFDLETLSEKHIRIR